MDISGINSNLTNYITSNATQEAEQSGFQNILDEAINNKDDEGLKDACAQFESYFLNQLFDEMRKTIPKSNLLESSAGSETYEDMLYESYAEEISSGRGAGIAEMLYKQLSKEI